eukprot:1270985-Amorphochlora_amoeboformis.AAC.1
MAETNPNLFYFFGFWVPIQTGLGSDPHGCSQRFHTSTTLRVRMADNSDDDSSVDPRFKSAVR